LIALPGGEKAAQEIYHKLQEQGIEVLYDDRKGVAPGEKLIDCDLIGIPLRIVSSMKTSATQSFEVKARSQSTARFVRISSLFNLLKSKRKV
jgi:prolyl-tRNA synthetase